MSLEAVQKVTQSEQKNKERRTDTETEAKNMIAAAEQAGLALLNTARAQSDSEGRKLMKEAEERAAKRSEEIHTKAGKDADALRSAAKAHLEEAAAQIMGRVVK